jgi:uncharacterized membrane protein
MSDISNQLSFLENSISISSPSSNKKNAILSSLAGLIIILGFKPIYLYSKKLEKNKIEKDGKSINVYVEKYKLNYKKVIIFYILFSLLSFTVLKYIWKRF